MLCKDFLQKTSLSGLIIMVITEFFLLKLIIFIIFIINDYNFKNYKILDIMSQSPLSKNYIQNIKKLPN